MTGFQRGLILVGIGAVAIAGVLFGMFTKSYPWMIVSGIVVLIVSRQFAEN